MLKEKTNLNRILLICFFNLLGVLPVFSQVTLATQNTIDNFPATTTHITGDLNIGGSFSMSDITDLTPLANIQRVDGDLNITFNDDLTSLNGLEQLSIVGGRIFITNNPKLSDCISIANLLASVNASSVVISNNGNGCNSAAEIQALIAVIPTFSQWGTLLFGILMLNLGVAFLRRLVGVLF